MHSSRMRTGRSLTVCWILLLGGGVCSQGGCLLLGGVVSAPGECLLPGGGSAPGGCIPACTEADTPLLTESQTPVKTLPWNNFVGAGKHALWWRAAVFYTTVAGLGFPVTGEGALTPRGPSF